MLFNAFSRIFFVVRDDSSHADVLYQTSDTTYNAYNRYGGNSLYTCTIGCPPGADPPRGYKVSFNRPNTAADIELADSFFHSEFQMVKWLEQNGYDVSYQSSVDTDRLGASVLQQHKVFMSSGHDEYWSGAQRTNVEAARDAGVNLAFFSGNEMFWKIRYENSTDGSSTAYRTQVVVQGDVQRHAGSIRRTRRSGPVPGATRGSAHLPTAVARRTALTGTLYSVNGGGQDYPIEVPAADGKMRFWRNTTVATQSAGQTATLAPNTIGFEWDADVDNGARPAGLFHLSTATHTVGTAVGGDKGTVEQSGSVTHHLTLYRAASGALGVRRRHHPMVLGVCRERPTARGPTPACNKPPSTSSPTWESSPQPCSPGSRPRRMSTDTTAPTTTITSPTAGTSSPVGSTVTVSGTARRHRRPGGGRRGEHRQRRDLAPGAGPRELDVPVACRSNGLDDSRGAGGRRQRQPANDRRGRHRARRMSVHALRQRGDSWPAQGSSVARGAVRRRTSSATA